MRKTVLILMLLICSGFLHLYAGEIGFQVGGGYNGYFTGSGSNDPDFAAGYSLFAGAGYHFSPLFFSGVEYEFDTTWSYEDELDGLTVSLTEHVPKVFVNVNALKILTITALGGLDFQNIIVEGDSREKRTVLTAGLRISALFAYAQYMMVFHDEIDHRFSAGVIFRP